MSREALVHLIAGEIDLRPEEIRHVVGLFLDRIVEALVDHGRVELRGFGAFAVKERRARRARNPRTGEPVDVPARWAAVFKPGRAMNEKVRGGAEKRQYPRIPADAVGSLRRASFGGGTSVIERTALGDLSEGGAFIRTSLSFEVEDLVEFDLVLPGDDRPVTIVGIVRWLKREAPRGIGVRFHRVQTADSPDDRERVRAYIARKLRKGGET